MGTFIEAIGLVFFGCCIAAFVLWVVVMIIHYLNKNKTY